MRGFILLFFLFLEFFLAADLYSQAFNPKCRYTSFGFSLKGSYFKGDVLTDLRYVRSGLGIHINRRISPRLTFTSELLWLRIMGNDYTSSNLQTQAKVPTYVRNLHFRNDIKQVSAYLKYDLFPNYDHYRKRPIYNLYGLIGISAFYHNPKAKDVRGRWVALQPLQTEAVRYSRFSIAVPIGAGVRYKLSLQWDLEVDLIYMVTFTDYLDDVSGKYADPAQLKSAKARAFANRSADSTNTLTNDPRDLEYIQNELDMPVSSQPGYPDYKYVKGCAPGDKRGSVKGFDGYAFLSIRLSYAIPGFVNCPKFRE
jgi:hypothetical protein